MSATHTGNPAAVTARQATVVTNPVDGEDATAASNSPAPDALADQVAFLMQAAALIGSTTTNTDTLDLSGPSDWQTPAQRHSSPTPTASAHVRRFINQLSYDTFGRSVRLYIDGEYAAGGPGLLIVTNAYWDGTSNWIQDDSSKPAMALFMGSGGGSPSPASPSFIVSHVPVSSFPCPDSTMIGGSGKTFALNLANVAAAGQLLGSGAAGLLSVVGKGTGLWAHEAYTPLALNSGWTAPSGNPKLVCWIDAMGLVHVFGAAVGIPSSSNQVATLPMDYRPSAALVGPLAIDTAHNAAFYRVATSGNIFIQTDPTFGAAENFQLNFTFPVDMLTNP